MAINAVNHAVATVATPKEPSNANHKTYHPATAPVNAAVKNENKKAPPVQPQGSKPAVKQTVNKYV